MIAALPLQQHPAFGRALTALGQRVETLALTDRAGAGIGSALAIWRRLPVIGEVGYLPRGPAWRGEPSPEAQAYALARLPVRLVEADGPCPGLRAAGFRQVATAAHVAEMDLTCTPEARRAALDGKWRHALRRAERSGVTVHEEAYAGDPSHWLLAREGAQRRERGYRAWPYAVTCALAQSTPGAARMFVAQEGREVIAAMLILLHLPVATYHIGWSGDRGRALSAHRLLLMAAADGLAAEGYARLDLGSVDTVTAPGLARFKIGTGACVRALGGSWLRLPFGWGVALPASRG